MESMPLIYVLMATYNGALYVEEQINSILKQTYPKIRLVIADDASTDETVSIIESYTKQYSNIEFYSNKRRLGFVKNFERLIEKTEAEYFALSDQDDIWEPEKLEKSMNALLFKERKFPGKAIMVHSDLSMVDADGDELFPSYEKFRHYTFHRTKDLPTVISRCGVMGNTIVFNKKLKDLILPFHADVMHHDYWIAVVNELFGIRVSLDDQLVRYRIHKNNASKKSILFDKPKKQSLSHILPYRDNNRYSVLKGVVSRFSLEKEDKEKVLMFIRYLRAEQKWVSLYPKLLQHGFFKDKGVGFHSKMLGKMFLRSVRRNQQASA